MVEDEGISVFVYDNNPPKAIDYVNLKFDHNNLLITHKPIENY